MEPSLPGRLGRLPLAGDPAPARGGEGLVTVRDVMARTGRGRTAVEKWLRSGALRAYRPDWKWLIDESDLERFLATHRYVPPKRRRPRRRPESLDAARARRDRALLEVEREGRA